VTTLQRTDHLHLARAIELAEGGRGRTTPNPLVGAVVVRDGVILGEGFHSEYGGPHAERAALAACGEADTRGATMYVSLEPCCHHGQTPPCTDAILEAGIARVVVASDDPTEKAAGRGLGILRDEGVEIVVAEGEVAARARLLNQPFRKHARTGVPWVLFKSAMTLDGKVATRTGDSKWISGEAARLLSHHWRAERDAVVVGIGTVLADDPLLTARDIPGARQPLRVVFDHQARLPLESQLLRTLDVSPVLVVAGPDADTAGLREVGAEILVADGIPAALADLGRRGLTSLFLEGGPTLAAAFAAAGEIDEARVFVAPILLGGGERLVAVESGAGDTLITTRFREW